jgi:hypothetical protein
MIDYVRSLKFEQLPNYDLLHSQVRETRRRASLNPSLSSGMFRSKLRQVSCIMIFHRRTLFK